jgi:hypothetical protein
MLSPDNYVHAGLGADGFNRYAYAGNNPLKYVDPSGEELVAAMMIAAFVNIVYQGWSGNAETPGDFLKAGLVGGLSGAAGGLAGQAISGAVGSVRFIGGALTGSGSGFAGGFMIKHLALYQNNTIILVLELQFYELSHGKVYLFCTNSVSRSRLIGSINRLYR